MEKAETCRLHAVVEGRVQGVGFRYFVIDEAVELGLKGWVRNRWDESVEVVAEGDKVALQRLLEALRRGPRAAYVTDVKVDWGIPTGEFYGFHVRPTA